MDCEVLSSGGEGPRWLQVMLCVAAGPVAQPDTSVGCLRQPYHCLWWELRWHVGSLDAKVRYGAKMSQNLVALPGF